MEEFLVFYYFSDFLGFWIFKELDLGLEFENQI